MNNIHLCKNTVLFVVIMAAVAGAQDQPAGRIVTDIVIQGSDQVPASFIRENIDKTQVGQPYDPNAVRSDLDRLTLSGRFENVYATTEDVGDDGIRVTFTVEERRQVETITFSGSKKFKDKHLLETVRVAVGDYLSDYAIDASIEALVDRYNNAGYPFAEVQVDRDQAADTGDVHFVITEGPRVRIRDIEFEGNDSISGRTLRGEIDTATYIWIFRTGEYEEQTIERDVIALRNYYRDQGYLDAEVSRRIDLSDNQEDMTVTFVIREGTRYTVRNVLLRGNEVFSDDLLTNIENAQIDQDMPVLADMIERARRSIERYYQSQGYINARITTTTAYADEPGQADVIIQINEGRQYRVSEIIVRGNQRTQDKVVRRALDMYPGDPFDLTAAQEAEVRLMETRLFTDARVSPIGEEPDTRDAVVRVTEGETTRLLAGAGVSSDSGLSGNVTLENYNFDLFDWPRSWGEFFSGRAFKGAGQTLRISAQPGTEVTRFRIDFHEPYLMDRPLGLGTSLYLWERGREDYGEVRYGTTISISKRFRKIWAAELTLRVEGIEIDDVDWLDPKDIREVKGTNALTSLRPTLVRDTTDSLFLPSRGNRTTVSWEQAGALGGDFTFSKVIGTTAWHKTLHTDMLDRKTIFSTKVMMGYIFGDAPIFERFYGGGLGSVRGFSFRGISPRAGIRDAAVGGDFTLLTGAEVTWPLVGDYLRGATFMDMGTVEENFSISTWRVAVGAGLRLKLDFFGPVWWSFDFAGPLAKDENDETQFFSFTIGTTFR